MFVSKQPSILNSQILNRNFYECPYGGYSQMVRTSSIAMYKEDVFVSHFSKLNESGEVLKQRLYIHTRQLYMYN